MTYAIMRLSRGQPDRPLTNKCCDGRSIPVARPDLLRDRDHLATYFPLFAFSAYEATLFYPLGLCVGAYCPVRRAALALTLVTRPRLSQHIASHG